MLERILDDDCGRGCCTSKTMFVSRSSSSTASSLKRSVCSVDARFGLIKTSGVVDCMQVCHPIGPLNYRQLRLAKRQFPGQEASDCDRYVFKSMNHPSTESTLGPNILLLIASRARRRRAEAVLLRVVSTPRPVIIETDPIR